MTKIVLNEDASESVRGAHSIGKAENMNFIQKRFNKKMKFLYGQASILNRKAAPKSSKRKETIKRVKTDPWLFSDLYVAKQSRAGDLDNYSLMKTMFFQYRYQNMETFVAVQS